MSSAAHVRITFTWHEREEMPAAARDLHSAFPERRVVTIQIGALTIGAMIEKLRVENQPGFTSITFDFVPVAVSA